MAKKLFLQLALTLSIFCCFSFVSTCFASVNDSKSYEEKKKKHNAFDGDGQLQIRGLAPGKLIKTAHDTYYYLSRSKLGAPILVALHDIPEDKPLFPVQFKFQNIGDGRWGKTYVFPPKMLEEFKIELLPVIISQYPHIEKISVFHYNARVLLSRGKDDDRSDMELPLIRVDFYKDGGRWDFLYRVGTGGSNHPNFGMLDYYEAFTVSDALKKRTLFSRDSVAIINKVAGKSAQKNHTKKMEKNKAIEKIKASRLPGIVYKSAYFWNTFGDSVVLEKVFKGNFKGLNRSNEFKLFFNAFVEGYNGNCSTYLPANSVVRRLIIERVTSEGGIEQYRETTNDVRIRIDPRFARKYDEYQSTYINAMTGYGIRKQIEFADMLRSELSKHPLARPSMTDIGLLSGAMDDLPIYQINKFINSVGCKSAAMYQMKENLLRAANNSPSLQSAGVHIPNAENESVTPKESINQRSIYEACKERYELIGDKVPESYCKCMDRYSRKVMTPEELKYYSSAFQLYYNEVEDSVNYASDARIQRLYIPQKKCVK